MDHLSDLINSVLTFGYSPGVEKMAVVVVLPKTSQLASEPHNYRTISFSSAFGKIAEAIILNRLKAVVDTRCILPEFQF
jgi:hypothetical protein